MFVSSGLAPGGQALPDQLSINVGLLASEDVTARKVAFVMGHEISHILLRHYEREEFLKQQEDVAKTAAAVAIVAAYATEMRAKKTPNGITFVLEDEGDVTEAAMMSIGALVVSQILADGVFESAWSRVQEFESDQLGYDLMQAIGLPGRASTDMLTDLAQFEKQKKTRLEKMEKVAEARMNEAAETANAKPHH